MFVCRLFFYLLCSLFYVIIYFYHFYFSFHLIFHVIYLFIFYSGGIILRYFCSILFLFFFIRWVSFRAFYSIFILPSYFRLFFNYRPYFEYDHNFSFLSILLSLSLKLSRPFTTLQRHLHSINITMTIISSREKEDAYTIAYQFIDF